MAENFEEFVHKYYESAYRFAYSLSRHADDALDITQQAFVHAQIHRGQLRDPAKSRQWLFTIVRREFLRTCRREQTRRDHSLEYGGEMESLSFEDHAMHIDGKAVLSALFALDEPFRAPLALFFVEQLSYREIAEVLEIPIGTVMSRLARGKAILRKALDPPDDRDGNHE